MNNKTELINNEEIIALRLMEEIANSNGSSEGRDITQRSLSNRLGIALGLVNTYIKYLGKKGYIKIAHFPKSRYKYLLTPEGMAEKSRLVYKYIVQYNNLFKVVRSDCLSLFRDMEARAVKAIVFCGVDEVAEIAFLSLNETSVRLVGFYDDTEAGKLCLGFKVLSLDKIKEAEFDAVFIASIRKREYCMSALERLAVERDKIICVGHW